MILSIMAAAHAINHHERTGCGAHRTATTLAAISTVSGMVVT
jgi:hypothetical protein